MTLKESRSQAPDMDYHVAESAPRQNNLPIDFIQLENTVNDMTYGVNDEDDLDGMERIMEERCPWFHKEDPQIAYSCWTYLNALPPTDKIDHAMDYFEFIMDTE